jgi:hypothetical protein
MSELKWLLRQMSDIRIPSDEAPPLGRLPHRRAIPLFQTDITATFRRSFDRLKMIESHVHAVRTVNAMLSEALNRQGLFGDALRQPRTHLIRALFSRYSSEFISYLNDLFRVVDGQNIECGVKGLRNLAKETLNKDDWSDEEGELVINTIFLVAATLDYFGPKNRGGREALSMIRFNRSPGSLAGRIDSLVPPRAALNAHLGVLVANPRIEVGASFEISQLVATLTAVNVMRVDKRYDFTHMSKE